MNPNGGGARNQFGVDFDTANHLWTQTLCNQDSDNDGRSNGEELGDPLCVWIPGQTPSRTSGITHPGVADTTIPETVVTITDPCSSNVSSPTAQVFNLSISNFIVPNQSMETFAIKLFDWTKLSPTNTTKNLYLTRISVKTRNDSLLSDLTLYSCTTSEVSKHEKILFANFCK